MENPHTENACGAWSRTFSAIEVIEFSPKKSSTRVSNSSDKAARCFSNV